MASNRYLLVVRSLYLYLSTIISVVTAYNDLTTNKYLFEAVTIDIIVIRKRYNDLTTNKYLFEAITTDIIVLRKRYNVGSTGFK
jgi:hypothetical protein